MSNLIATATATAVSEAMMIDHLVDRYYTQVDADERHTIYCHVTRGDSFATIAKEFNLNVKSVKLAYQRYCKEHPKEFRRVAL